MPRNESQRHAIGHNMSVTAAMLMMMTLVLMLTMLMLMTEYPTNVGRIARRCRVNRTQMQQQCVDMCAHADMMMVARMACLHNACTR